MLHKAFLSSNALMSTQTDRQTEYNKYMKYIKGETTKKATALILQNHVVR